MKDHLSLPSPTELQSLKELTMRVGADPLLTQASTGNSSVKADGFLWIKKSGKWMADAMREQIFIPLELKTVRASIQANIDPAGCYPGASLEAAMHAALPQRVVLHVHCINTIAWAVQEDAPSRLKKQLDGLGWSWIPYRPSGLPLCGEIGRAIAAHPDHNLFILGNHGLVLGGEDVNQVEQLLDDVRRRLAIPPRDLVLPDVDALSEWSRGSGWKLPADYAVHSLAIDPLAIAILQRGFLYPCQAMFFGSSETFDPIPWRDFLADGQGLAETRRLVIVRGRGVLMSNSMTPAELATVSGLVQVLQRLSGSCRLRYLTQAEVDNVSGPLAYSYRQRGAYPASAP